MPVLHGHQSNLNHSKAFFVEITQILLGGGSIICVLLSHIGNYCDIRYTAPLGGAAVACFLMISGYGLSSSFEKNGLKSFWKKRFLRIWIPYLIIRIIMVVVYYVVPAKLTLHESDAYSFQSILLDITLIKPKNPNGWYMTCILFWYLMFYLINRISLLNKYSNVIYLLTCCLVLVFGNELWGEQAFSFYLGVSFFKIKEKTCRSGKPWHEIVISLKASVVYLIVFVSFFTLKQILRNTIEIQCLFNFIQMMYKAALAMLILCFGYLLVHFSNNVIVRRLSIGLYVVGMVSYELYLSHGYYLEYIRQHSTLSIIIFYSLTILLTCIVYFSAHKLNSLISRKSKV